MQICVTMGRKCPWCLPPRGPYQRHQTWMKARKSGSLQFVTRAAQVTVNAGLGGGSRSQQTSACSPSSRSRLTALPLDTSVWSLLYCTCHKAQLPTHSLLMVRTVLTHYPRRQGYAWICVQGTEDLFGEKKKTNVLMTEAVLEWRLSRPRSRFYK